MSDDALAAGNHAFVARHAALLTLVEVGLGSLIHGLNVPLGGQLLSCNQGFLLCRAVKAAPVEERSRMLGSTVSNVAALLKSLSPAGKKLTPMLAISAQGLLFSLGCIILGANFWGAILGITLMSLWAFLQPLLIAYLLFGNLLIQAFEKLFESMTKVFPFLTLQNFGVFLLLFVVAKIFVCWALCIVAYFGNEKKIDSYMERLQKLGATHTKPRKAEKSFFSYFLQPLFLISFAVTLSFFYLSEAPRSQFAWIVLRPIAVAALMYFLALNLPLERWTKKLQQGRYSRFGAALNSATRYLKANSRPQSHLETSEADSQ
jgi:hypothetical protein